MLTPACTALAIPAFITAPLAPAALAEEIGLSRRRCTPRLSVSPRSWTSPAGSALPPGHCCDVATARRTRPPPTGLYSIRRDFLALSPLHSTSPVGWGGGSGSDESCFASRLLDSQHTTSPARAGSAGGRWRRRSTGLGGLRKPRDDADDSRRDGGGADKEADGGGGKARPSRSQKSYGSSIPASRRQPPEEDDIWSKHSVFEFKSLNDPDTNACGYTGLSGQPRGPSWDERRASSQQEPAAPDRRLPSAAKHAGAIFDGVEELLEAERPTSSPFGGSEVAGTAAGIDEDLFRFREKGAIAGTNHRQVERRRRGPAGGGRGGGGGGRGGVGVGNARSAVKVELATQLGVPATSSYDELRTAYRVEIKRCHPDLAGDNEFRVKFLERKFQKLQGCWDKFNAEQTAGRAGATASAAEAEAGGQAARARARARAQEVARERQRVAAAAAAAARRSRRPVMDEGRTVLDSGNTSSC